MSEGSEPAARLTSILLEGGAGSIDALIQERGEAPQPIAAIVLHPHPLYGGTLHNKVVHRVAGTMTEMGAAVLRINFRGVGKSEGVHDRGEGELDDARLALHWLAARHPGARLWVAGFSFGSWVASRLAASESGVEQLLLIAPPVHTQSFAEMRTSPIPKRIVQGLADDICRPERLVQEMASWAMPRQLLEVEGATHFFDKQLQELGNAVHESLSAPLGASTRGPTTLS